MRGGQRSFGPVQPLAGDGVSQVRRQALDEKTVGFRFERRRPIVGRRFVQRQSQLLRHVRHRQAAFALICYLFLGQAQDFRHGDLG
jgi:hypothetical protein